MSRKDGKPYNVGLKFMIIIHEMVLYVECGRSSHQISLESLSYIYIIMHREKLKLVSTSAIACERPVVTQRDWASP